MPAHMGQTFESFKNKYRPGSKFFHVCPAGLAAISAACGRGHGAGVSLGATHGYVAAMFVVIGLIVAFVLIAVFSNRATRYCRWRERRGPDLSTWTCIYCGATVEGQRGQQPRTCLRPE